MKINHVSTHATSDALRLHIRELQNDMLRRQKEVATGRLADYGETLGTRSYELTGAKRTIERLTAVMDTNALSMARLQTTQESTGLIGEHVQQLMNVMTASMSQNVPRETVLETARQTLAGIEGALNTTYNGESILGGINNNGPVTDGYLDGAAKAAFDASFLTHFGFTKNDAAAALIDEVAILDFLNTVVEPQFFGTDWTANYSNASDTKIVSRITLNRTEVTSVSANEGAFRGAVMAAVIVTELFDSNLAQATVAEVAERALQVGGRAISDLADVQARAGISQEQITRATARLESQSIILQERVASLEGVDQYEASTDLSALLTQLEISYSLTSRVQQLSIMRFL